MHELSVRLADFDILIRARHAYVVAQCKDYLCPTPLTEETADLTVEHLPESIWKLREILFHYYINFQSIFFRNTMFMKIKNL